MPRQRTIDSSRRVTVTLEGTDYKHVVALARKHGLSVAWVVRRAVSEFIARQSGDGTNTLPFTGQHEK